MSDGAQLVTAVRRGAYQDSVTLMALSTELERLAGVVSASVMMGTPANKELLEHAQLLGPELAAATPNDLCIALRVETNGAARLALETIGSALERRAVTPSQAAGRPSARTLAAARRLLPDANLAVISVPGAYAAREARQALDAGLHALVFSDHVPIEDEVGLKRLAAARGLLLMGPDCGTAIVGGVPVGFANAVPRGHIGLVGASGTGLQVVSSLVARLGLGVSHALGTGSRDLHAAVGGLATRQALRALLEDPATHVLVWVSKPGDATTTASILDELVASARGKPLVAMLLGLDQLDRWQSRYPSVRFARTLDQAAECAVSLAGGGVERPWPDDLRRVAERAGELGPCQRRLRGFFAGGTLGAEAAGILAKALGLPLPDEHPAGVLLDADGHRIVDYGDDVYTQGRAHPMIDPRARQAGIRDAVVDEQVGVLLLDVVLGFGAHPDPAAALAPTLLEARAARHARGGDLLTIVSVVGTEQDPQSYSAQVAQLGAAGAIVAETNAQAARYAAAAIHRQP